MNRNASYREIGGPDGLLARLETFDGNSMSARGDIDNAAGYSVYSYDTEIARVVRADNGRMVAFVIRSNSWGITTGKHLAQCAWLPGCRVEVTPPYTGGLIEPRREWLDGERLAAYFPRNGADPS